MKVHLYAIDCELRTRTISFKMAEIPKDKYDRKQVLDRDR
jgi:hypothetical protein